MNITYTIPPEVVFTTVCLRLVQPNGMAIVTAFTLLSKALYNSAALSFIHTQMAVSTTQDSQLIRSWG